MRTNQIINCSDCGCQIVTKSSTHARCGQCSESRAKKQRNNAAKARYARIKSGGPRYLVGTNQQCECGEKFTKTSPTTKRCPKCQTATQLTAHTQTEEKRAAWRAEDSATKYASLTTICQICNVTVRLGRYQDCRKYCRKCSAVVRKLRSSIARIVRYEAVDLSLQPLINMYMCQKGKCAISGLDMHPTGLCGISIDRISSNRPHSLDNIHLTCAWANWGRNKYSIDEFKKVLGEALKKNPNWLPQ